MLFVLYPMRHAVDGDLEDGCGARDRDRMGCSRRERLRKVAVGDRFQTHSTLGAGG